MTGTFLKAVFALSILMAAQSIHAAFWEPVELRSGAKDVDNQRNYQLDDYSLREFLDSVPQEHTGQSLTIQLPMPDGHFSDYQIFKSNVMSSGLSDRYPSIQSFKVYGIDDPLASGRLDISIKGFRGMLQTANGRVFIDPDFTNLGNNLYRSVMRRPGDHSGGFVCSASRTNSFETDLFTSATKTSNRVSGSLKVYRIAVAATQEYVNAVGGNKPLAMAEINTAINRVNDIYERDFGIRLQLIANNDVLIDDAGSSLLAGLDNDPFGLLTANQAWVDSLIADADYDIGHVFSTGGGGVASFESVCATGGKARGVTGLPNPTGDGFYIDYVAHEIGHQFGADHTFNGTTGSCGGNRNASTAFEPGSGSTVMGYAGICGTENIQGFSEVTFHSGSIAQINAFAEGAGNCHANLVTASNPNDPTVDGGEDFVIPVGTAFSLTSVASDLDGDTLSYQWDQLDAGSSTDSNNLGGDQGDNALFRVFDPVMVPSRDFPALGTQVFGRFDLSEVLPCTARDLNFRITVRDGKSGMATDDVRLSVNSSAGPFEITSQSTTTTLSGGENSTITWNVANTDTVAGISCSSVDIDLLTFAPNYATYSVTSLVDNTPNDGSYVAEIPDSSADLARIRVMCSDNIFYDISDADLIIDGAGTADVDDTTTFFNTDGLVFSSTNECTVSNGSSSSGGGAGSGTSEQEVGGYNDTPVGTGSVNLYWLMLVTLVAGGYRKLRYCFKLASA